MSENHDAAAVAEDDLFDIGELAAADTADMTVIHPKSKLPTTWVWTFAGPGHAQTIALNDEIGQADRAEAFQERKAIQSGRDPKARRNAELIEINVRRYSGRVLNFTPARLNGEDLRFTPKEAHRILKDPKYGWLWTQVFNFLRDEDVFITSSEMNS
jgi:hypothetical protein